ncbi:unnamed protein product [Cylindrotheca closterium]|uniref:non-specific serine/threonine protein kinase n=1 Tax=Cylindrotheca closterium TaxID=2856 RepID=A0AAD2CD72_9STRA|nr:unnamed protein product [Cylindrotheca closterium]
MESTIDAHIPKSENPVEPSTISTRDGNSEPNESNETSPVTEKTMVTPETQPQSISPIESHAPTSTIPPAPTENMPLNGETPVDEPKIEVVAKSYATVLKQATEADNTGTSLPANTITAEAETDSKESTNQPADPRSGNDSIRTTNSKSSITFSNGARSVDPSSGSEDDFITSPHGKNAIVERSPGERYVRFMEKLGSGASKEVYRAYDTQEGIEVAWNVVHLAGVPRNERNRIVNEVQLLERLHHHNIISFHGSWVNRAQQQVNFVTEILSSGTLKSFITKVQVIRWKIAKRWAIQILKGLQYLHTQEPPVIHRDLKCENIFINGTSGDLRIGDLGLSTVHRNGRQLSVLGTPEFMAPDMYEDNPYDEKVDVYSFGMCMLEIFTKEIPYRECNNPAQIYMKVSRGDPPDSLKRIQSTHAKAFVELCLGRVDENGKYIRPSATELLEHPFLQKRPSDDDEVEVLPLMQERAIAETSSTSTPSVKAAVGRDRSSPASSSSHANEGLQGASSSSRQMQHSRSNSLLDDGSDRFELMPDSEVNIRKVKVMAGRGLEYKDEDDHIAPEKEAPAGQKVPNEPTPANPAPSAAPVSAAPTMHYLVAAAVIENDSNAQPYEDDILKLVVTLPVEGQTQNVQFDFHLVQDDAIQVAKEMVAELGIPQGAVLEISETISGLARAARVSQDKYLARHKGQNQGQGHLRSTQMPSVSSLPAMPSNTDMGQNMAQQPSTQSMVSSQSHQSMHEQQQQQVVPNHSQTSQMGQNMAQHPSSQSMVSSQSHQSMHEQQQQQVVPNHSQTSHVPQLLQAQGMQVQEQSAPMSHGQHAPMPAPMQSHGHVQPLEMTKQNSDVSSQSYGQQSIPINAQQLPSHMNAVNAGQQADSHLSHNVGVAPGHAGPSADTNSSHPNYGQPIPVPSQMGIRQTSGVGGQSDAPSHSSAQSTYGQPIPVPSQMGVRQTSGVGGQSDAPSHNSSQSTYRQPIHVPPQMGVRQTPGVSTQSDPSAYVRQTQGVSTQSDPSAYAQPQQAPISSQPAPQSSGHHAPGMHVMQQQQSGSAVAPQSGIVEAPPAQSSYVPPQGNQVQGYTNGITSQAPTQPASQHPQHVPFQPSPMPPQQQPVQQSQTAPQTQQFVPAAGAPGSVEGTFSSTSPQDDLASMSHQMGTETAFHQMNGMHPPPAMERLRAPSESDQMDEELAVELRKLDEEFKKTVSRAKKVFDSRMDTISRLQHEREALHQKTLSEHEKQRIEFEKRLQQEEMEQNRRIQQLQKDWARKREEMKLVQGDLESLEMESPEHLSNHDATNHAPMPSAPEGHNEEG